MIRQAGICDLTAVAVLAQGLWPHHILEEMAEEFASLLDDSDAAVFLAFADETPVGFAQCQLRRDYVEGTESSPVGYLEGVYVIPEYRKSGVARRLLSACEDWARTQGCREFASDCELTNTESLSFYLNVGFTEANRIICFTKKL